MGPKIVKKVCFHQDKSTEIQIFQGSQKIVKWHFLPDLSAARMEQKEKKSTVSEIFKFPFPK